MYIPYENQKEAKVALRIGEQICFRPDGDNSVMEGTVVKISGDAITVSFGDEGSFFNELIFYLGEIELVYDPSDVAATAANETVYIVTEVCSRQGIRSFRVVGKNAAIVKANTLLRDYISELGDDYQERFDTGDGQDLVWGLAHAEQDHINAWCNWAEPFDIHVTTITEEE